MSEREFLFKNHNDFIKQHDIAGRPLKNLISEIQEIYIGDDRPWIIGFSGGKDSTAVLSLVFHAMQNLDKSQLTKPVYVVSSDTLVETPVVVDLVNQTIKSINSSAKDQKLPISAHSVFPKDDQTFWVNLLGRGYPAPRQSFRWCTERMKIDPVTTFITAKVAEFGEVIVCLGSRTAESASRAQVIAKHKIDGSSLSRHSTLPNAYTYMPIQDWTADEVWMYLLGAPCPWDGENWELFDLYKGSNQGECPLVIDTSTPSCGNSRFGCWTCTVVTEDKALHGLIDSGMDWMKPLLDFRNELYKSTIPENKTKYRNYKRRTGRVSYINSSDINDDTQAAIKHIPGPYLMEWRQRWLQQLLEIENEMNTAGHPITLIQPTELIQIRKQWLRDPNEPDWADSLPRIYNEVYPDNEINWGENDAGIFSQSDSEMLEQLGENNQVPAELIMKLIEIEMAAGGLGQRRGIINRIHSLLSNDWETLDQIKARHEENRSYDGWKEKLTDLQQAYEEAGKL